MKIYSRSGKRQLRETHFHSQNGICAYCFKIMNNKNRNRDDDSCTLEHIIPKVFGGKNCSLHTIAVCHGCNQKRDSMPLTSQMMYGIFLFKGIDGLIPISANLFIWFKHRLCVRTRHFQMFSIVFFG